MMPIQEKKKISKRDLQYQLNDISRRLSIIEDKLEIDPGFEKTIQRLEEYVKKHTSDEKEDDEELPYLQFRSKDVYNAIQERLVKEKFSLKPVVSYTTRPIREGEVDGREHIFISSEEFNKFDERDFAAYTFINGNHYFTTFSQLRECNTYVIDPVGINSLIFNPRCESEIYIFYICAPEFVRYTRYINRENSKDKLEVSKEFIKRNQSENTQFSIFENNVLKMFKYSDNEYNIGVEYSWYNGRIFKDDVLGANNKKDIYENFNYIIIPNYTEPGQNNDTSLQFNIGLISCLIKEVLMNYREGDMKPLFCFVGRTSSGKDTLLRKTIDHVNN